MRLLNAKTLQLKEFLEDSSKLRYAILSHRWGEEEISFHDMTSGNPDITQKKGYDKTSSAELSEAINSMYQWYATAHVCYVYLSDVAYCPFKYRHDTQREFMSSQWFKRAWTLQELLAPRNMHFFDRDWVNMGSKRSLLEDLSSAAGVPTNVLCARIALEDLTAALKMSWAAERTATRPEDEAYSLFGLFGVNMPLLYGEGGPRVFRRLQFEILQQREDYSLLTLCKPTLKARLSLALSLAGARRTGSTLGRSPIYFGGYQWAFQSGTIRGSFDSANFDLSNMNANYPGTKESSHQPPTVTGRGLHLTLMVLRTSPKHTSSTRSLPGEDIYAWTYCTYNTVNSDGTGHNLAICIQLGPHPLRPVYSRRGDALIVFPQRMLEQFRPQRLCLDLQDVTGHLFLDFLSFPSLTIAIRLRPRKVRSEGLEVERFATPAASKPTTSAGTWDEAGTTCVFTHELNEMKRAGDGLSLFLVKWNGTTAPGNLYDTVNSHIFVIGVGQQQMGPWIPCHLFGLTRSEKDWVRESFGGRSFNSEELASVAARLKQKSLTEQLIGDTCTLELGQDAVVRLSCDLDRARGRFNIEVAMELAEDYE